VAQTLPNTAVLTLVASRQLEDRLKGRVAAWR
jgi:hypothetical protein